MSRAGSQSLFAARCECFALAGTLAHDPACDEQSQLYDRFVRNCESPDPFSAKRLYPGLTTEDALARIKRLRDA